MLTNESDPSLKVLSRTATSHNFIVNYTTYIALIPV